MSVRTLIAVIFCAHLLAVTAASAAYRFTFSNPAIGQADAPLVLEYFSAADCGPCLAFEKHHLPGLLPDVRAGRLQVVFRDLPSADGHAALSRQLFCLQEVEDLLAARLRLKLNGDGSPQSPAPMAGLPRARWQACMEDTAAEAIASHNLEVFSSRGFVATPSFVLTHRDSPLRAQHLLTGAGAASAMRFLLSHESQKLSFRPED